MLPSGKEALKIGLVVLAAMFIVNKIPQVKAALGG